MKGLNLVGQHFDRWTVLSQSPSLGRGRRWVCQCICGTIKIHATNTLRGRLSKSCGCLNEEKIKSRITHGQCPKSHGESQQSPEYRAYYAMLARCKGVNKQHIRDYQQRNITVCSRWLGPNGFINFFSDLGKKPTEKHTLERRDNAGGYHPDNCFWATRKEQTRNRRNTVFVLFRGEKIPRSKFLEDHHIPYVRGIYYLERGLDPEKLLNL